MSRFEEAMMALVVHMPETFYFDEKTVPTVPILTIVNRSGEDYPVAKHSNGIWTVDLPRIEYTLLEYLRDRQIPYSLTFDGYKFQFTCNGYTEFSMQRVIAVALSVVNILQYPPEEKK